MRNTLLLVALLTLVFSCKSTSTLDKKSVLSQNIYIDTTWTKDDSPITISGNRWVMGPATLTIERGTIIQFTKGSYLNVEGSLMVKGSSEEPVVFKPAGDCNSYKCWEHINLKSKRKKSVIQFATFQNSNAALFIETDKVDIRNCTFTHNTHAVYIKNSSPRIFSSTFTKNKTGIISFSKNKGEITRNKFIKNIDIGISAYDAFSPKITKNIFKKNKFGITLKYTKFSNKSMKPEIIFNDFKSNKYKNLHLSGFPEEFALEVTSNYWGDNKKFKIKGNVLTDPNLQTPQFQETLN